MCVVLPPYYHHISTVIIYPFILKAWKVYKEKNHNVRNQATANYYMYTTNAVMIPSPSGRCNIGATMAKRYHVC